jgi:steroid delta-isomerase-like uncharacterized protein
MSTDENKRIVRRVNEEMISQNRPNLVDELFAESFVDHSALPGFPNSRQGVQQLFGMFHSAFSDFHVTIEDQVAEEDKVTTRKTFHGTHTGDLFGIPATNRTVQFEAIDILRIENGKVTEHWTVVDQMGMMQQLGVVPSPAEQPLRQHG